MMRHCLRYLALLLCVAALAQKKDEKKNEPHLSARAEPLFVLKVSLSQLSINGTSTRSCIIVYPDESFRFEKSTRTVNYSVTRTTLIAADKLTEAEAAQVMKIIHDSNVAMLDDSAVRRGGFPFKKDLQAVYAAIPRSNVRAQSIAMVAADGNQVDPAAA